MNREPDPQDSAPRRVEAYLDTMLTALPRLSDLERETLRRELHEHLWSRIEAYKEQGQTEDAAVNEALRQFGSGRGFLWQWRREWAKTPPQSTLRELWAATRWALLLSIPALLITCLGSPVWSHSMYSYQLNWLPDWLRLTPVAYITSGWGSFGLGLVLLPLAVGVAVGRLVPQRASLGMLAALTLELVSTDWIMLPTRLNLGRFAEPLSEQIFFCAMLWLPLACGAAALTGWWTRRTRARRIA